jgi:hypothetical protein
MRLGRSTTDRRREYIEWLNGMTMDVGKSSFAMNQTNDRFIRSCGAHEMRGEDSAYRTCAISAKARSSTRLGDYASFCGDERISGTNKLSTITQTSLSTVRCPGVLVFREENARHIGTSVIVSALVSEICRDQADPALIWVERDDDHHDHVPCSKGVQDRKRRKSR